eukprot:5942585-Amphidinium_carterae.1
MVEIGVKAQPGPIDTGGDPRGDPMVENCVKAQPGQFDTGGDPGGTPAELMILKWIGLREQQSAMSDYVAPLSGGVLKPRP